MDTRRTERGHSLEFEELDPVARAVRESARLGEERSLVDLVLLACDFSDDPVEIGNMVDGLVTEASSRLLSSEDDPMLGRWSPAAKPEEQAPAIAPTG